MSKTSKQADKSPTPPNRSAVVLMLGDIADTSWRMFVPTVGLMTAGYFCRPSLWHQTVAVYTRAGSRKRGGGKTRL